MSKKNRARMLNHCHCVNPGWSERRDSCKFGSCEEWHALPVATRDRQSFRLLFSVSSFSFMLESEEQNILTRILPLCFHSCLSGNSWLCNVHLCPHRLGFLLNTTKSQSRYCHVKSDPQCDLPSKHSSKLFTNATLWEDLCGKICFSLHVSQSLCWLVLHSPVLKPPHFLGG